MTYFSRRNERRRARILAEALAVQLIDEERAEIIDRTGAVFDDEDVYDPARLRRAMEGAAPDARADTRNELFGPPRDFLTADDFRPREAAPSAGCAGTSPVGTGEEEKDTHFLLSNPGSGDDWVRDRFGIPKRFKRLVGRSLVEDANAELDTLSQAMKRANEVLDELEPPRVYGDDDFDAAWDVAVHPEPVARVADDSDAAEAEDGRAWLRGIDQAIDALEASGVAEGRSAGDLVELAIEVAEGEVTVEALAQVEYVPVGWPAVHSDGVVVEKRARGEGLERLAPDYYSRRAAEITEDEQARLLRAASLSPLAMKLGQRLRDLVDEWGADNGQIAAELNAKLGRNDHVNIALVRKLRVELGL